VVETPRPTLLWIPPEQCPGCGSPCQLVEPDLPGYYDPLKPPKPKAEKRKKRLKKSNGQKQKGPEAEAASKLQKEQGESTQQVEEPQEEVSKPAEEEPNLTQQPGLSKEEEEVSVDAQDQLPDTCSSPQNESVLESPPTKDNNELPPLCKRCKDIMHHSRAPSLPAYPTIKTLSSLLLSSRHKHNHIYHLIDAADFPLSLERGLRNRLYKDLPKQITRNLTISYIITRSDILFPQREQISSLMSYFKTVIKDFLPEGEKVEGRDSSTKLHAISSRRGWDIGTLKEEISQRQGGIWFLGGVNVGKSSLLRDIWPVDGELRPVSLEDAAEFDILPSEADPMLEDWEEGNSGNKNIEDEQQKLDKILAEAQVSENAAKPAIHVPPTISEFPGTTAAPIRVSFKSAGRAGKCRGEVVDLPGLERWVGFKETGLNRFVRADKHRELLLKTRPNPEQYTIKPGKSMSSDSVMTLKS
jgi:hypothetical protein